jgi:crotonobetainyl-CoA:carnitine CoA-transferase CaiB-like acyl-CoA transferase
MTSNATSDQGLPLKDVRVLELAHIVAGPSAGLILADLGADVLKIEHPVGGDTGRSMPNLGAGFLNYNRNKRSLALNVGDPKGREVFERLVRRSDVVINNYLPGALDRLGVGYEWASKINKGIIYCSVKGFLPGPYWSRPLLDELAQMAGGLAYLTGPKGHPLRAAASVTDITAAAFGVVGILAALRRREKTGLGENIESGLFETVVFWMGQYLARAQISGKDLDPHGGGLASGMGKTMGWGVYQLFPTKDERQIFIAVTSNRHWAALCDVLGFDDWKNAEEFSTNRKRSPRRPQIAERVTEAVKHFNYEDIADKLYRSQVPFAPVNTPMGVVGDRHLEEGDHWFHVEGAGRKVKVPKLPLHMAHTAFELRAQPPNFGQHTDDVLRELGYEPAEIAMLKEEKIVRRTDMLLEIDRGSD